jgi:hypothetical protein
MNFTDYFFIVLSIVVLSYLIYIFQSKKRIHLIIELFFLGIYGFVLLFFLFPQLGPLLEETFGISSIFNFILAFSVFVAYFVLFLLYTKTEEQRMQITGLNRELTFIKNEKKKK